MNDSGNIDLISESGDDIGIANLGDTTFDLESYEYDGVTKGVGAATLSAYGAVNAAGVVKIDGSSAYTLESSDATTLIGSNAAAGTGPEELFGAAAATNVSALNDVADIDVSTAKGAQDALSVIDGALTFIDSSRAELGAVQNRLNSTISNLDNIVENASASRSRIRDTDFAKETTELTKNQILQQASTSILAQAQQLPQAALSLLG
ncbi:flagellin [Echinimonas agarilytica]|uniref:flagellin n=1 Tax=Echinimonas agarilytica TaxID=1215918 RepID=UPI003D80E3A6